MKQIILIAVFLFSAAILKQTSAQQHDMHNHKMDIKTQVEQKSDENIVREGVINLKKIDKNKDGKVFQDMMDWNVISDKPGECPLCKMTLEEVTLKQAKENLVKNKFKVKS
ncbi:MAG: heavy metal-binding domain-containing protein [Syntrophothermus sp.]|nr:heavy metal-binding domain-containing protein [Ignavibacteriaceae bacterium]